MSPGPRIGHILSNLLFEVYPGAQSPANSGSSSIWGMLTFGGVMIVSYKRSLKSLWAATCHEVNYSFETPSWVWLKFRELSLWFYYQGLIVVHVFEPQPIGPKQPEVILHRFGELCGPLARPMFMP